MVSSSKKTLDWDKAAGVETERNEGNDQKHRPYKGVAEMVSQNGKSSNDIKYCRSQRNEEWEITLNLLTWKSVPVVCDFTIKKKKKNARAPGWLSRLSNLLLVWAWVMNLGQGREPWVGLHTLGGVCLRFSPSPSPSPHQLTFFSLFQINKLKKKKYRPAAALSLHSTIILCHSALILTPGFSRSRHALNF